MNLQQHLFPSQVAKLSTGDSLDMTQQDESTIVANDATVKDMEVFITCFEPSDHLLVICSIKQVAIFNYGGLSY